jgi:hypothetical protein
LVSVLLVASILCAAGFASAADFSDITFKVNGETVNSAADMPTVTTGETVTVQVKFKSAVNDDVKLKLTLEGEDDDTVVSTSAFDVENGEYYIKTLSLKAPSELDDDLTSEDFELSLEIGDDDKVTLGNLHVQRTSYEVAIKSILTSSTLSTGSSVPVQIVLKNVGYNDVEDLYVTASIAELGVEKKVYFGDLIVKEVCTKHCDDDEENSVVGTIYLDIPYNAKSGVYALDVEVTSDDSKNTATKQVTIENSVSDIALKSGNSLVLLNPTSKLVVYTVSYQGSNVAVVIPAQSSQTVPIEVPASGDYKFDVSVFSGETLLSTVNFTGTSEPQTTSPVLVLTVILAIVFLVLLVVLVVLITKKPQKAEEFGESYY